MPQDEGKSAFFEYLINFVHRRMCHIYKKICKSVAAVTVTERFLSTLAWEQAAYVSENKSCFQGSKHTYLGVAVGVG